MSDERPRLTDDGRASSPRSSDEGRGAARPDTSRLLGDLVLLRPQALRPVPAAQLARARSTPWCSPTTRSSAECGNSSGRPAALPRPPGRPALPAARRPLPGGGAFHPKTYLFARADEATLIVGSGNLTRAGHRRWPRGFVDFTTQREEDLPSLRAWARGWAGSCSRGGRELLRVVDARCASMALDDRPDRGLAIPQPTTSARCSTSSSSGFPAASELHVSAPYYDRDAKALESSIDALRPRAAHAVLRASAKRPRAVARRRAWRRRATCASRRFEPPTFVHAKLIGAVCADGRGLLFWRLAEPLPRRARRSPRRNRPRQLRGGGHPRGSAEQVRRVRGQRAGARR